MRPPQPHQRKNLSVTRVRVLAVLLVALLAALEWRLIHLQVLRHPELEEKAEACEHTIRTDQSWRGEIQDCHGRPLAMTVPAKDIYADLTLWTNRVGQLARVVAPLLGTEAASLAHRVDQALKAPQIAAVPRGTAGTAAEAWRSPGAMGIHSAGVGAGDVWPAGSQARRTFGRLVEEPPALDVVRGGRSTAILSLRRIAGADIGFCGDRHRWTFVGRPVGIGSLVE